MGVDWIQLDQSCSQIRFSKNKLNGIGARWLICRFGAFRQKGRGFEYRSNRHVGTLCKSFTRSCLRRFGVKLRYSVRAVSGAPLSSSGLEEAL